MTTGGDVGTLAIQFTLGAPPWPELPVAFHLPSDDPPAPLSPMVPGFDPWALFQWYVINCTTQYDCPLVEKLGERPPPRTPPPLELSKSFDEVPEHVQVPDPVVGLVVRTAFFT